MLDPPMLTAPFFFPSRALMDGFLLRDASAIDSRDLHEGVYTTHMAYEQI